MDSETSIWLDGEPASALPLPDRAVEFGDGLFETLLLRNGHPLYPELHWQRLRAGLQALSFPACLDSVQAYVEQATTQLRQSSQPCWTALRLTVTRGGGPRGYAAPDPAVPRVLISAVELQRDCHLLHTPARLILSELRWSSQPALAGIKHLNRLEQVLAASSARRAGADEALMLNQEGQPLSVSAGNLFAVRSGAIVTPMLTECGIDGTRRRLVLEQWAPAIGLQAREEPLTLAQLETADEVFISNALVGLRPVSSLGPVRWHSHPVCKALHHQYVDEFS